MDAPTRPLRLERRQRGDDLDDGRCEPDLLLGLAEGRGAQVGVVRLRLAAREPELATVETPVVSPDDKHDSELAVRVAVDGDEHRRVPQLAVTRPRGAGGRRSSSRRRITRASPSRTSTAAGRVTPL